MQIPNLRLMSLRGNWSRYFSRQKNPNFVKIAKQIHARDNNTCCYCGFQSEQHQKVINLDHNYSNNIYDNLATACEFCAQCLLLDGIGQDGLSGGNIIYLPEIKQTDLNQFCRVLFCSMIRDVPYKGKLQATYLSLQDRSQMIENIFGPGTSNAAVFGQSVIDSMSSELAAKHQIMDSVRFLPHRKHYKNQLAYWRNTVFAKIPL